MLIVNEHIQSQNAVIIKNEYEYLSMTSYFFVFYFYFFSLYNQPQYCALLCPKIAFFFKSWTEKKMILIILNKIVMKY